MMPSFPAFRTKPYYDALKTWLTTSLNEDGTLKSSAVATELAKAETAQQAAAAAVATEAATFEYGPYITDDVQAILAADDTPAQAAALAAEVAIDNEIIGRDLLEGADILEDDIAFAVVDEDGRRTWLEAGMDGGPTAYAAGKVADATGAPQAMDTTTTGLAFAIVDEDDRRTWIEADADGKPTTRALGLISDGLSIAASAAAPDFPSKNWAMWGDSLVGNNWPTYFASLTGRQVYNGGNGGQTSGEIAARQGGVPARVVLPGNTIPASGPVTLTSITPNPVNAPTITSYSETGWIAGVFGTLTEGVDATTVTFTRDEAGDAVSVPAGSYFLPKLGDDYRDRTTLIWAGRNDVTYADPYVIAANIRAMIDSLTPRVTRALVLEVVPWNTETPGTANRDKLDTLNAILERAFTPFWVPVAQWLRTDAAATAAGITFTADDLTDIANEITPRSLRSDGGHLNTDGQEAVAAYIYDIANARGWL